MADAAALSAAFESHRAHLLRVAYGTLGSVADAEDVVQEAWLRLARLENPAEIEDLRAWLTRVVGRLALDALRRARRARETYFGEWLPEPVVGRAPAAVRQLAARARRHVDQARPRHPATREDHRRVVEAFAVACAG